MRVLALVTGDGSAALRLAVQLGECIAVAVTAEPVPAALVAAHREGAASLIRLWDAALAEPLQEPLTRELTLSTLLGVLCRRLDCRFIVVPETADGWLAPALAEELDLPHVSGVLSAELVPMAPSQISAPGAKPIPIQALPTLKVRRRGLHGVQRLRGPAVGVLAVMPTPADERPPPAAAAPVIESWDLARLGLSAMDLPRPLLRAVLPERRSELAGRSFADVNALAERLRQDGLCPTEEGA